MSAGTLVFMVVVGFVAVLVLVIVVVVKLLRRGG